MNFPEFTGSLQLGDLNVAITGSIQIRDNGAIEYNLARIPISADTIWLLSATGTNGRIIPRFKFLANTPEGIRLWSDQFYILSQTTSSDSEGRWFQFGGDIVTLQATYAETPATSPGTCVRYFQTGMKCFGAPTAATTVGQVTLLGAHEIEDSDLLNGTLNIVAPPESQSIEEWLSLCDKLASKILDMVSLAEGRLFRWSVRQVDNEAGHLQIAFYGPRAAGAYQDGIFHFLNLQPVLDLAINNYTDAMCEETGLPVAVEWFVHHPDYMELQLVSAITSLEHLVGVFTGRLGKPPIVDPNFFRNLLAKTKTLWNVECALTEEQRRVINAEEARALEVVVKTRERLADKLPNLNDGSFKDQLEKMLNHYAIPLEGLGIDRVKAAVDARNRVVHSGIYRKKKSSDPALHEHVAVLRELLVRIFLNRLHYSGQYWSIVEAQWRNYPPVTIQIPTANS